MPIFETACHSWIRYASPPPQQQQPYSVVNCVCGPCIQYSRSEWNLLLLRSTEFNNDRPRYTQFCVLHFKYILARSHMVTLLKRPNEINVERVIECASLNVEMAFSFCHIINWRKYVAWTVHSRAPTAYYINEHRKCTRMMQRGHRWNGTGNWIYFHDILLRLNLFGAVFPVIMINSTETFYVGVSSYRVSLKISHWNAEEEISHIMVLSFVFYFKRLTNQMNHFRSHFHIQENPEKNYEYFNWRLFLQFRITLALIHSECSFRYSEPQNSITKY